MSQNDLDIANTITDQIGNLAFRMMGAKNLVAIESGLVFKLGKGAKHPKAGQVTHLEIVLDAASDTYTVRAIRVNMRANVLRNVLEEVEGVYVESLHAWIEKATGFYLKF